MKIKHWIQAFRLPFLTATLVPVVLGSSIAWHHTDAFNWSYFFYTLIGISFLHIGTNVTNDYFDHKTKNDELNTSYTQFNGGSRVIQDGLIPPSAMLAAALISFGIGSAIGLYLSLVLQSPAILVLGMIGVFFGFFYTANPLKIGYYACGELVVGLCFGPLVVAGSYYVQAQSFSMTALWASIPVGILIALVLYINEFPDHDADKLVHKKTMVVIMGKQRAVKVYHILLAFMYFYVLICTLIKLLPVYTLVIFITLPLAVKAYVVSKRHFDRVQELLPANFFTINLHLIGGLLLSAGFILDKIW